MVLKLKLSSIKTIYKVDIVHINGGEFKYLIKELSVKVVRFKNNLIKYAFCKTEVLPNLKITLITKKYCFNFK